MKRGYDEIHEGNLLFSKKPKLTIAQTNEDEVHNIVKDIL